MTRRDFFLRFAACSAAIAGLFRLSRWSGNPMDVLEPMLRRYVKANGLTIDEEAFREARAYLEEEVPDAS